MLSAPRSDDRHQRPQRSLRQEYDEYVMERIEGFKNQLARNALLAIADEAVRELEAEPQGQFLLTEIMVWEYVDRLIAKRQRIPTYNRWREKHIRLRRAQREPVHWGLPPKGPLTDLSRRLEPSDLCAVAGAGGQHAALFLAAHDADVLLIDDDLTAVEAAENRAGTEALGTRVQGLFLQFGGDWFPDVAPVLCVLDAGTLGRLAAEVRDRFLEDLKARTTHGGIHCLLPAGGDVRSLSDSVLQQRYQDWSVERQRKGWFVAIRP